MINLYLLINILVLIFPLLLSFDRRVRFYRQWPAVLPALLIIAAIFLAEDVAAAARGHWEFSLKYAGEFRLLGLPAGEWLFFLTVPFACLFSYACVRSYLVEKTVPFPRWLSLLMALAALSSAIIFRHQGYTRSVLILTCLSFLSLALLRPDLPRSRHFWTAMGITYIAFALVNGVLTSVPVVTYGMSEQWGIRIGTIPLEDFFYSFSLLTLNFVLFRLFLDRGRRRNPADGEFTAPGGRGGTLAPPAPYTFMEHK